MTHPICLVGIGKIAVDQHVPAIAASAEWSLAATVSRAGSVEGVTAYTDFDHMLRARDDIRVVSLCLPPVPRFDYAAKAIAAGRHVMLEKPPGATLAEVHQLQDRAAAAGVTLFATWHSRAAAAVAPAKAWLADKAISSVQVAWKEDVRKWHPGQGWVFAPGGMGVFDPGINALSILTEILPFELRLTAATLTFPANKDTPIAADLTWADNVTAVFDWRQTGPQIWDISIQTDAGLLEVKDGGTRLLIDGAAQDVGTLGEYPNLYQHMAKLVATGTSDVDTRPLVQVADAFTLGQRVDTDPFEF